MLRSDARSAAFEKTPAGFFGSRRSYRWSKAVGILGTGRQPGRG
jgi:hypothetical protein